jgi:hypothetical protein
MDIIRWPRNRCMITRTSMGIETHGAQIWHGLAGAIRMAEVRPPDGPAIGGARIHLICILALMRRPTSRTW